MGICTVYSLSVFLVGLHMQHLHGHSISGETIEAVNHTVVVVAETQESNVKGIQEIILEPSGSKSDNEKSTENLDVAHAVSNKDSELQCLEETISNEPTGEGNSDAEICRTVSLQCIHDSLQKLLEDPTKEVSGRDYACILVNLLQRNTEYTSTISKLENSLKRTEAQLYSLTIEVESHSQKFVSISQFQSLEKGHAEKFDKIHKQLQNVSGALESQKQFNAMTTEHQENLKEFGEYFNRTVDQAESQSHAFQSALLDLNRIGGMWSDIAKTVDDLGSRSSKIELEIVSKISDFSEKLGASETSSNQMRNGLMEQGAKLQELHNLIEFSRQSLASGLEEYKIEMGKELENATMNMKEMLQRPFSLMDDFSSRLQKESERALKSEQDLAQQFHNQTLQLNSLRGTIERESSLTTRATTSLEESQRAQRDRLRVMEEDLKAQVKIESLRAKGTEAQLSSIMMRESDKHAKTTVALTQRLEQLGKLLVEEMGRAGEAEESLEKKLQDEIARSTASERGLLENVNLELSRASKNEERLEEMLRGKEELISSLEASLSQVNQRVEKINEDHQAKFNSIEDRFLEAKVKIEMEHAKFETRFDSISRETGELEQGLLMERDNILGIVQKDLEAIGNTSTELVNLIEMVGKVVAENYTTLQEQVEEMERSLVKQGMNLHQNFTHHILSLAEEIDKKFDSWNSTLKMRLQSIETEVKKLGTVSGAAAAAAATATTSRPGGVFNRIVGLFGGRRPSNSKKSTKSVESKPQVVEDGGVISRLRVENVFKEEEEDLEKELMKEGEGEGGGGRSVTPRKGASGARALPVLMQRINSKVQFYGPGI